MEIPPIGLHRTHKKDNLLSPSYLEENLLPSVESEEESSEEESTNPLQGEGLFKFIFLFDSIEKALKEKPDLELHQLGDRVFAERKNDLPIMPDNSLSKIKSYCECYFPKKNLEERKKILDILEQVFLLKRAKAQRSRNKTSNPPGYIKV